MFTIAFAKALAERAITVFSSSLAGLLTAGGFGLIDAPWEQSLSVSGMAALVAVLLSIGGGAVTSSKTPDFTSDKTQRELGG
ncbi:holin [Micromonospora matsumotoense]|uniref:holin n=1 Tax=Micromonospora matsumotoense TaxID=121616 RepID=UPI0033CE6F38